ncbi:MAG: alpha/beta fold hydrolase [Pirellulales bacterium]|nr:alpha/beta fold hydrolase [Pirellulales bacterium]
MTNSGAQFTRLADGRIGLRRFHAAQAGAPRILALPYAGGQSLAFRELAHHLPRDWGFWAIDPPGHGWSAGDPLPSIPAMVRDYLAHLPAELLDDAVLLGHSLGGCVVFALTQALQAAGRAPRAVVLSGARPPHRKAEYESFLSMDDARLLEALIQFGGVPKQWADEPDVFDHFKHALRADFQAFEAFEIEQPLTGVPVMVFGGTDDVVCRPEHVFEWSQFCPGCRVDFVPGGHMFVQTEAALLSQRLQRFVRELPDNTSGLSP